MTKIVSLQGIVLKPKVEEGPRTCRNCKWARPDKSFNLFGRPTAGSWEYARCGRTATADIDLVTGKQYSISALCAHERRSNYKETCTVDGKYFEPRK